MVANHITATRIGFGPIAIRFPLGQSYLFCSTMSLDLIDMHYIHSVVVSTIISYGWYQWVYKAERIGKDGFDPRLLDDMFLAPEYFSNILYLWTLALASFIFFVMVNILSKRIIYEKTSLPKIRAKKVADLEKKLEECKSEKERQRVQEKIEKFEVQPREFSDKIASVIHAIVVTFSTIYILWFERDGYQPLIGSFGITYNASTFFAFSLGYFLYDFVHNVVLSTDSQRLLMVHAAIGVLSCSICMHGYFPIEGAALLFSEASTPFWNLCWFCAAYGHEENICSIAKLIFGVSFIAVRNVMMVPFYCDAHATLNLYFAHLYRPLRSIVLSLGIPLWVSNRFIYYSATLVTFSIPFMNYYWGYQIFFHILRMFSSIVKSLFCRDTNKDD
jgi:hypothetical protein